MDITTPYQLREFVLTYPHELTLRTTSPEGDQDLLLFSKGIITRPSDVTVLSTRQDAADWLQKIWPTVQSVHTQLHGSWCISTVSYPQVWRVHSSKDDTFTWQPVSDTEMPFGSYCRDDSRTLPVIKVSVDTIRAEFEARSVVTLDAHQVNRNKSRGCTIC